MGAATSALVRDFERDIERLQSQVNMLRRALYTIAAGERMTAPVLREVAHKAIRDARADKGTPARVARDDSSSAPRVIPYGDPLHDIMRRGAEEAIFGK